MRYTIESFKNIVEGRQPLPNRVPLEDRRALNDIAARGHMLEPVWGYAATPLPEQEMKELGLSARLRTQWAQFFLHVSNGSGIAIIYGEGAFEFVICRHEKVPGPGANPVRGWHPGHCRLCGLDMTVDSSD